MTRVTAKVVWYSPCVKWIEGGTIGKIAGGGTGWVVGWVCGRGFSKCIVVKGV